MVLNVVVLNVLTNELKTKEKIKIKKAHHTKVNLNNTL